jgi:serine/threonine protein kinase
MKKRCTQCCQENASSAVVCGFCLEPFPKASLSLIKTIDTNQGGQLTHTDTADIEAALKDMVLVSVVSQKEHSVVYSAENVLTKERYVVKVQHYEAQKDRVFFLERNRQLQKIQHPSVMRVVQFGALPDGRVFVVSEPLTGMSLRAYMKRKGRLSVGKVTALGCQLAAALEIVHSTGLTHGNLRPENIYLREVDGRPVVTLLGFRGKKTKLAEYSSPEQVTEKILSPKSDLYSLGAILFEMLTGRLPFLAKDLNELLTMQSEEHPPKPSALVSDVPSILDAIILCCLEKHPDDRPKSADALKTMLSATLDLNPRSIMRPQRHLSTKSNIAAPLVYALLGGLVACAIFAVMFFR